MKKHKTDNLLLGKALNDKGNYREAIKIFTKCIERGEGGLYAYMERGIAKISLGLYSKALKDINHIIYRRPKRQNYNNLLGVAYFKRAFIYVQWKMYEEALKDINISISMMPDNIFNYSERASIYSATGRYKLALRDINKAIVMNNTNALFYIMRAGILMLMNEDSLVYEPNLIIAKALANMQYLDKLDKEEGYSYDINYFADDLGAMEN